MNWLLRQLCTKAIRTGALRITDASGAVHDFGDGTGRRIHLALHSPAAERAIGLHPGLGVPEAYMDGQLDFLEGDVIGLLELAYGNASDIGQHGVLSRVVETVGHLAKRLHQRNTIGRSLRNVHHHYDLSGELYRMFLDEDMQYSCAYFEGDGISLEEAQRAKKRHIAAKLQPPPGARVLDIGCGWGGMGLFLARHDAEVLGVTLSSEQLAVAQQRARAMHLDDRAHFELRDYRAVDGSFDRIVSVGMFEHVGVGHYRTYFDKCAELLKPDGVMVLHTIGRSGPPAVTASFIRKYIFPGGYIPALSEMLPAIEKSGLVVTDVEVLRLHYALTLKQWRERFMANRARAVDIYDERFARMWEFYLAASEAAFRWQDLVVFQIQLARRNDSLPLTRDYIGDGRERLRTIDGISRDGYSQAAE